MLRGWAQYHSPVVAKATFTRVEHAVFKALWRWAKRRHQRKERRLGAEEVLRISRGTRNWSVWDRSGDKEQAMR
ncbi:group II intron maturase-specific domain-containing protein (plasmid) [Cupriavidus basilensis]